ncbi:MAG: glycosyltransferase [Pseudomonadota bacterium]
MKDQTEISAIVPVSDRFDESGDLARQYLEALDQTGRDFELIYVLDGRRAVLSEKLDMLAQSDSRLRILQLARTFGESTALSAGIEAAHGKLLVSLPAYFQIEPSGLSSLIDELEKSDMAVAVRSPRAAVSRFEVLRRNVFHWLVSRISGSSFEDLGCGARAFTRKVGDEVPVYGDQHRFMPLLAIRRGFKVRQVQVRQSERDRNEKVYGPKVYLQRLLDILTIVFLVRFTKKPLRFFGMIGSMMFLLGGVFLVYLVGERLFLGIALAERPALLLSSLLVVLGLQVFALGLLGELIIFTHARQIKEYTIDRIVN